MGKVGHFWDCFAKREKKEHQIINEKKTERREFFNKRVLTKTNRTVKMIDLGKLSACNMQGKNGQF